MKLPSISNLPVQSSICNGYYWNNGTIHHSVLSSPRSGREYCNSISFVTFGGHGSKLQQQLRKEKLKYPILFAQLRKSDSFESNSGRSHEDVADADIEKYGSKFSIQKSSERSNQSHINEEEGSNDLSFSNKNFSEYSLNYGVWLSKLQAVHLHVLAAEQWNTCHLNKCNRTYLESATNLIHYLAVNSLDVNQLKEDLYSAGLLNLDCSNFHVLASITSCVKLLQNLQSNLSDKNQKAYPLVMTDHDKKAQGSEILTYFSISAMKKRAFINKEALFGPAQDEKNVNIMVTVGREAIENQTLLADIIKAGANVIRINCAHDDPTTWSEIIRLARHSSQMLEKPCRILMDLAGPKLRTGTMNSGPPVMRLSPRKDAKGDVMFPALVWLSHAHPGSGPPTLSTVDATLFVENECFLKEIEIGNVLKFIDFRGRKRSLKVSKKLSTVGGYGFIVECSRTAYVGSGTKLFLDRKKRKSSSGIVVNVPPIDQFIRVRMGDLLTIIREASLSKTRKSDGTATITCNSSRLFDSVKPGDPIAFDDGKIWGVVRGTSINEIVVTITHASPKGSKLGSEKSINIPKSEMHFEGLTSKDLMDLEFVAANADMVGISFIRDARDMEIVLQELKNRKLKELGIILKIETCSAFDRLPLLLLQAMQSPNPLGVMIARGDLAVECGWDQMATIQEEILSICNAAHVPVIWATQVLESLTKRGIPTRAEITDVACGMRTSCIMLNKGKYIVEAVSTLKTMLANRSTAKTMKNLLKPLLPTS